MAADKTFPCDICGKAFKHKRNLNNHTRIHNGEKPYACETCEKTFTHSSSLADHERIHTGEKPYVCNICEKAFTFRGNLAQHKMIHTGEKPYTCNICENTFTQSSSLAKHKRIHTDEKPYACNICEKAFTQRGNLVRHKGIHKGNTAAHSDTKKGFNVVSFINQKSSNDCGEGKEVKIIKEEINEEESVDDPLSIHQDNEIKEEDMYDYDTIDIEEFKIVADDHINNIECEDKSGQNNVNQVNDIIANNMDEEIVDDIEENVNEVEENVVDQENNDFQGLENLSVAEALAFFSS